MSRRNKGTGHPATCRRCGAKAHDGIHISRNGLCRPCGVARIVEMQAQLAFGEGELYERWLQGMRRRRYHPMRDPADGGSAPD